MMRFFDDKERLGTSILLIFSVFYLRHALEISVDPFDMQFGFTSKTLPIFLATTAILVSLYLLFLSFFRARKESLLATVGNLNWIPMLSLIMLMAIYIAVFDYLGFLLSNVLFLLSGFFLLGERRLILSISISLGLVIGLWLLLTQVFGLYLDSGSFYHALRGQYD